MKGWIIVCGALALAGCQATTTTTTEQTANAKGLDGSELVVGDEATTTPAADAVTSKGTVGGEHLEVALAGGTLRIELGGKDLSLRVANGDLTYDFAATAGGERSSTYIRMADVALDDAMASARGPISDVALSRYSTPVGAALHVVESWPAEKRDAARRLLGAFIASLPRATAAGAVTPRWGDVPLMEEAAAGECGSICGVAVAGMGGCSVSCSGGYCASCEVGGDAITCTCKPPSPRSY